MHILHVSTELTPIAKVGGLGDVVLGLGRELAALGHRVDVILPKYDTLDTSQISDLAVVTESLMTFFDGQWHPATIWQGWVEGLKCYFVEAPAPLSFFSRGTIYGNPDDAERFLFFSRAVLEFLLKKPIRPDIIHLHEWQTAAVAPLYRDVYRNLGFSGSKVMFTIHNIEYQGQCSPQQLTRVGLTGETYLAKDKLGDPNKPNLINLMKGAIVYCDSFNTVSPNYAKEVQSADGGRGLEGVITQYKDKFCGILNGVDYSFWNPETDRYLSKHFSARKLPPLQLDSQDAADGKASVKKLLRERLQLMQDHRPIVSSVGRLVPQKGIPLIKHALRHTLEKGGQFILLGSSPIPEIQADFDRLKAQYEGHPHARIILRSSEELAHLIFGGSDMTIVPSLFEPCGLTQLIALHYGTIPIVRRTGGLADTIFDVDTSGRPFEECNGYSFDFPDYDGVNWALDRALACWFDRPDQWHKLMLQGMAMDFSWNSSALKYLDIYKSLVDKKPT